MLHSLHSLNVSLRLQHRLSHLHGGILWRIRHHLGLCASACQFHLQLPSPMTTHTQHTCTGCKGDPTIIMGCPDMPICIICGVGCGGDWLFTGVALTTGSGRG